MDRKFLLCAINYQINYKKHFEQSIMARQHPLKAFLVTRSGGEKGWTDAKSRPVRRCEAAAVQQ